MEPRISRRHGARPYQPLPPRAARAKEPPAPDASIARRIVLAAARIRYELRPELEARGLPPYDVVRVLWALAEHSFDTEVGDVGRALGISRSAASRALDRAEASGLIDKYYRDLFDCRLTHVRVNKSGYDLLAVADEALVAVTRSVLGGEATFDSALARPFPARRSKRGRTMARWLYRNWRFLED